MAIEYLGLSEINGPLVVLEGVKNASYEEIVEFHMDDGTRKIGRIIEIYEDKAVIQVFEGTGITCTYTKGKNGFKLERSKMVLTERSGRYAVGYICMIVYTIL